MNQKLSFFFLIYILGYFCYANNFSESPLFFSINTRIERSSRSRPCWSHLEFLWQGKQLIFQFVQKCMFTLFRLVEGATVDLNYVYILLISLCIKQRKRETLQSMNHSWYRHSQVDRIHKVSTIMHCMHVLSWFLNEAFDEDRSADWFRIYCKGVSKCEQLVKPQFAVPSPAFLNDQKLQQLTFTWGQCYFWWVSDEKASTAIRPQRS